jgi:hypothetical protein
MTELVERARRITADQTKLNADLQAGHVKLPPNKSFVDMMREECDAAIADQHARMMKYLCEPIVRVKVPKAEPSRYDQVSRDHAAAAQAAVLRQRRFDAVITLAQSGAISHEQMNELLVHPDLELPAPKVDPLDAVIDGQPLHYLLDIDRWTQRELSGMAPVFTPAQRAAVSARWSAELRAKVEAKRKADEERERSRVLVDCEDW